MMTEELSHLKSDLLVGLCPEIGHLLLLLGKLLLLLRRQCDRLLILLLAFMVAARTVDML